MRKRKFHFFTHLYRRWRQRVKKKQKRSPKKNRWTKDIEKWSENEPFAEADYLNYKWQKYSCQLEQTAYNSHKPVTSYVASRNSDLSDSDYLNQSVNSISNNKSYYYKFGVRYDIDLPPHIPPHHHHARCQCGADTTVDHVDYSRRHSHLKGQYRYSDSMAHRERPVSHLLRSMSWKNDKNSRHSAGDLENGGSRPSDKGQRRECLGATSAKHSKHVRQYHQENHSHQHGCQDPNCSCQMLRSYNEKKEMERKKKHQEKWERHVQKMANRDGYKSIDDYQSEYSHVVHFGRSFPLKGKDRGSHKDVNGKMTSLERKIISKHTDGQGDKENSDVGLQCEDKKDRRYERSVSLPMGRTDTDSMQCDSSVGYDKMRDVYLDLKGHKQKSQKVLYNRSASVPNRCCHYDCACKTVEEYSAMMERKERERKMRTLKALAKENEENMKRESGISGGNDDAVPDRTAAITEIKDRKDSKLTKEPHTFLKKLFRRHSSKDEGSNTGRDKDMKNDESVRKMGKKDKRKMPTLFERDPDAELIRQHKHPSQLRRHDRNTYPSHHHSNDHGPCSCQSIREFSLSKDKDYIEHWLEEADKAYKSINGDGKDKTKQSKVNIERHNSLPSSKTPVKKQSPVTVTKQIPKESPSDPQIEIRIHRGYKREERQRTKSLGSSDLNTRTGNRINTRHLSIPHTLDKSGLNENLDENKDLEMEYPSLDIEHWDAVKKHNSCGWESLDTKHHTGHSGPNEEDNPEYPKLHVSLWDPDKKKQYADWVNFDDSPIDWVEISKNSASVDYSNPFEYSPQGDMSNPQNWDAVKKEMFTSSKNEAIVNPMDWGAFRDTPFTKDVDITDPNNWDPFKSQSCNHDKLQFMSSGHHEVSRASRPQPAANSYSTKPGEHFPADQNQYIPTEEWTPVKPLDSLYPEGLTNTLCLQDVPHSQPETHQNSSKDSVDTCFNNASKDSGFFSPTESVTNHGMSTSFNGSEQSRTDVFGYVNSHRNAPDIHNANVCVSKDSSTVQSQTNTSNKDIFVPYKSSPHKEYNEHNENSLNEMSVVRKVKSKSTRSKKRSWTGLGSKLSKAKYEELHEVPVDVEHLYDEWDKLNDEEEIDAKQIG